MKLKGKQLNRRDNVAKEVCFIPRYDTEPLSLIVSAVPLTWNQRVMEMLPAPTPPEKLMTKPNSSQLMYDDDKKPIRYTDFNDANYTLADYVHSQRMNCWMVYEALRFDETIEFENNRPTQLSPGNVTAWLDKLQTEFNDAGFTSGDLSLIIGSVHKLSNLTMEEVTKARDSFLLRSQENKNPGNSQNKPEEISDTQLSERLKELIH